MKLKWIRRTRDKLCHRERRERKKREAYMDADKQQLYSSQPKLMKYEGLILDVEGVAVPQQEFWNRVNSYAGTYELIETIYLPRYWSGELDYKTLNSTAVRLLKENKMPLSKIRNIAKGISLSPGLEIFIDEFRKGHSEKIALLSAGLDILVEDIKIRLGIDYSLCNKLEIENGDYTGKVIYLVDDKELNKGMGARRLCEEMGVNPKNMLFVGDGMEDAPVCDVVGTTIAINPQHRSLEEKASVVLKNVNDLTELLKYI